jgi:hypothetical protein
MPLYFSKQSQRRALRIAISGLVVLASAGGAAADTDSGRAVAQQWCATCQAVTWGQPATDAAPSFSEIASRSDLSRRRLRVWLSTPHARLPDLSLSRTDIDAVIDYLQSLPK